MSTITIVALRAAATLGVNVTSIAHLLPGASGPIQVLASTKSVTLAPVTVTLLTVSGTVPEFVRVIDRGPLVVWTTSLPKSMLDALRLTIGTFSPSAVAMSAWICEGFNATLYMRTSSMVPAKYCP